MTIQEIRTGLLEKEFSARELAEQYVTRIRKKDQQLHAFLNVTEKLALGKAAEIDEKIAKGLDLPALSGVPCSVKDAILVEGVVCTAGSRMLENYIAPYDATVVQKIKEAGALIVGKTNMDEFGMGSSTENSAFGPTKNPHDLMRVPGGTSGGSAASVAAEECVVSLGEDTGGSIRLPASFCGVVGLKPTYGAVSRYGIIAVASSLDQVGPMTNTVEDCEILFNVIRGHDPFDSTSIELNPKSEARNPKQIQNLRIGVPKEYFREGLDPQVEKVIREAIQKLEDAGVKIIEVSLPHATYALADYYIINMSEISANLARYDGIRYGTYVPGENLLATYMHSRGEKLGPEVKRRIMLGTFALSAGYYDAYYAKAQKVRELLRKDFQVAFEKVDIIAGPVSPFLPFKIGERVENPLAMYLVDIYTVTVNLVGLPALSMNAGKVGNLPVGLQLIAPAFGEQTLFATGKAFEKL